MFPYFLLLLLLNIVFLWFVFYFLFFGVISSSIVGKVIDRNDYKENGEGERGSRHRKAGSWQKERRKKNGWEPMEPGAIYGV